MRTPPARSGSRSWSPREWSLVAWSLIVVVHGSPVAAEDLSARLKPLDLKGYAARTTPPDFNGRTGEAKQISLADLRGHVIILNFWASWCHECRLEMPALEELHRDYASRGLIVLGVNLREAPAHVRRYAGELGLTFPLVLDADGKINGLYGVVGLPVTFIVARDGRAVAFAIGPREWSSPSARALIQALLAEPSGRPAPR